MPRLGWSSAFAAVALCFVLGPGAACQSPQAAPDQTPRLIPRTRAEREQRFLTLHRIILNVEVADSSGKPITGLGQADFTVYDNNQPRNLAAFSIVNKGLPDTGPGPHVILVLDTVNNYSKSVHSFVREVESFLKDSKEPLAYPVSIGVLSGARIDVGPSSRDRDALLSDLETRVGDLHATGCITQLEPSQNTQSRNFGGGIAGGFRAESSQMLMCLNDRFVSSLMAIRQLAQDQVDVPGRAIVIWIGPGWPLLTNKSFTPDPPDVKRSFYDQLVSLSTTLREAQVTVNAAASPDDLPYPAAPPDSSFFDAITDQDQVKAGNLGLHALAHQTGGRIVTDVHDLARQIQSCIDDAGSYYVLSFDSPPAANFGEYHSLAVKVDKPDIDVRTNTLYYAEQ